MDEVELFPEREKYEPSPIKRLERKIRELEESRRDSGLQAVLEEVVQLVKENQKFVREVMKSNEEIKGELAKQPGRIEAILESINTLLRSNQRLVEDVIKSNNELKEAVSSSIKKNSEVLDSINELLKLVRAAGEADIKSTMPEALKPVVEEIKKVTEAAKSLVETNREISEKLDKAVKKIRLGTPVSKILEMYPNVTVKRV